MEWLSIATFFVLINYTNAGVDGVPWTYSEGALDQIHWAEKYPACGGHKQSPIDIQRRNVRHNPRMPELELTGYDELNGKFLMTNNGHSGKPPGIFSIVSPVHKPASLNPIHYDPDHSVKIDLPPTMMITEGLPDHYTAVQMHLHWGGWDLEASGAEHTLDGIRYMAELHVVHYNSDKYKSFAEAKDKSDGLAVLAFVYEDGHFENTYYSDFISNLANVKYAGQSMNLSTINVRSMLPENLNHFFRYEGSLTTPPCYESVIWTVFDTPITISHNQIRKLESTLMDHDNKTLWNDYRIAQPLNDRVVESSFLPRLGKGTFCRQEEIEAKLLKIESLLTSVGKNIHIMGDSRSTSKRPKVLYPLVLHFPERNTGSYALAHLTHPMGLLSFTACMAVRAHLPGEAQHAVFSYSTPMHDNELVITLGQDVGLWIGNEFINLPHELRAHDWAHYCVTWASHTGGAELWINGLAGEEQYLRAGYAVMNGGMFILGKDQDGFLGISDMDAFVGHMTDVNMWDYVLSATEIREQMSCENNTARGNVLSWGVTQLSLYGGVQLDLDHRCP